VTDLRLEQYNGAWAIHEHAMNGILDRLGTIDLNAHIAAQAARDEDDEEDNFVTRLPSGIAVMDVRGTMTKYGSSLFNRAGTVRMRRAVRGLMEDKENRSLVVRFDSPGGSVAGTADLADDLKRYGQRKKLIAYIDDVGASAAYWAASQADRIVVNSTAIVGSLAAVDWVVDSSKMFEMQGKVTKVIRGGRFKLIGVVAGDPLTAEQEAELQSTIDVITDRFVKAVASGRGMSVKEVRELATGAIWVGADAVKVGLADAVGSLDDVIGEMEASLGIKKGASGDLGVLLMAHEEAKIDLVGAEAPVDMNAAEAAEDDMSTATDKGTSSGPQPATFTELKAAMPTSTAEFRESCVERSLTLVAAQAEFSKIQQATIAEQAAKLKAVEEELAGAKLAGPGSGIKPLGSGVHAADDGGTGGDDADAFIHDCRVRMAGGTKRHDAVATAVRLNRSAHQAYVARCIEVGDKVRGLPKGDAERNKLMASVAI